MKAFIKNKQIIKLKTKHNLNLVLAVIFSMVFYNPSLGFCDGYSNNIKGYVHCGDKPVAGVVVTDGYSVTTTDAQGIYYLNRHDSAQFVIITMPSNYEANTINNIHVKR